ncbi:acetoacetate--CoA ligase [Candidatus Sororendozoicomonas aggregata]|uniref:acetoacetate--CoA ligase n=1 Tax=Candidatus Sororendozoicomonas aggregata TaxID=3073239 RepID=UPI002ED17C58
MMTEVMWFPGRQRIEQSTLTQFMQHVRTRQGFTGIDYHSLHHWSVQHRAEFWSSVVEYFHIQFHAPAEAVLKNDKMPGATWFVGATLNYAEHLLRRADNQSAIIFRGEQGKRVVLSFADLTEAVTAAQGGLIKAGVTKGDRVAGVMPNCPETVIMMLATATLGAIWSSCSPDFGLQGIIDRFGQITPKVLVMVDGYYYNGKTIDCLPKLDALQQAIPGITQSVVVPFIRDSVTVQKEKTLSYSRFLDNHHQTLHIEPVAFNHPLFILYSSGTTGVPKCIVHGHGGTLLQHVKELGLHTDLKKDDRLLYFTTCGWMMWNWQVSALALGATLVLFDGSPFYPSPTALMDIIDEEEVSVFGTSAKYISALEKAGAKPDKTHQLLALRTLLSTGSTLAHESFDYVYRDIKKNLCLSSISGGTDIISCFVLGCPILPVRRGQIQCRGLGMDVHFLNDNGQSVINEKGELACLSSFPAMPVGFWNDPDNKKYHDAYFNRFNGIWVHGDYGELTDDGGIIIHGRSDAVLNPGGVRIGTAEIYRQVEKVSEVLESLAVGQDWNGDVRVVLFVKLRERVLLSEALLEKIRQTIRTHASPRHVPAKIVQVADIPRTVSGKIVELAVREIIHGRPVKNQEALANPEALAYFREREELST